MERFLKLSFTAALALVAALCVNAQETTLTELEPGEAQKTISESLERLQADVLDETMPEKLGEGSLSSESVKEIAGKLDRVAKALNAETNIRCTRGWLVKLAETAKSLSGVKYNMEAAAENKDAKAYGENLALYKKGIAYFKNNVENPEKFTLKDLMKAKKSEHDAKAKAKASGS